MTDTLKAAREVQEELSAGVWKPLSGDEMASLLVRSESALRTALAEVDRLTAERERLPYTKALRYVANLADAARVAEQALMALRNEMRLTDWLTLACREQIEAALAAIEQARKASTQGDSHPATPAAQPEPDRRP